MPFPRAIVLEHSSKLDPLAGAIEDRLVFPRLTSLVAVCVYRDCLVGSREG